MDLLLELLLVLLLLPLLYVSYHLHTRCTWRSASQEDQQRALRILLLRRRKRTHFDAIVPCTFARRNTRTTRTEAEDTAPKMSEQ